MQASTTQLIHWIGLIASCAMPLFNIPMILHVVKRRSSADISITWVGGIWTCILLMLPAALVSQDIIFKLFGILNLLFFSAVLAVTIKYRKGSPEA